VYKGQLGLVVKSADWFLAAAEKIGVWLKLSPFVLGVLLVGLGTSLPELATSIAATVQGENTIVLANVIGSNIANVLLIIGLVTVLMGTIRFEKDIIDLDVPLLVSTTILFIFLLADGVVSRGDGIVLMAGFAFYVLYSIGYREDKEHHKGLVKMVSALTKETNRQVERHEKITTWTIPVLIASIALLAGSSQLVVEQLLAIVQELNVEVAVASYFVLAIGTSLPELTVSIKALRKNQGDLVVGNIIGSCMFNMLLIGGSSAVLTDQKISSNILLWAGSGLLVSVLLLMAGSISKRIHIWEGMTFILLYITIGLYIAN